LTVMNPVSKSPASQRFIVWALLLWISLCLLPGVLFADEEYEFRPEFHLTVQAATDLKIQVGIQGRMDDHGEYKYQHTDIGLAYTGLAEWLDVSLNYRLAFEQLTEDTWSYGTVPSLNATARFQIFDVKFSNRLRFEYATPEDLSDFGAVRNKIALNPPIYLEAAREGGVIHAQKIRPFVGYEFFYKTDSGQFYRHRFQGGLSFLFSSRVGCDAYYTRQETLTEDEFEGLNIIGSNLSLLF